MILHITLVQPEHELIHISAHMLLDPLVIDAVVTSLQDRPDALNAVRVRYFVHELINLCLTASCLYRLRLFELI